MQDESSTGEDGIDGIEGANTRESVAAVGGVQLALDEGSVGLPANDNKVEDDHGVGGGEKASRAASALAWKGNRPRVRFYTHQVNN